MKRKVKGHESSTLARGLDGPAFRELARAVFHQRRLTEGAIRAEQFERILEAARWTPSVANRQPWLLASASGNAGRDLLELLSCTPGGFSDFFAPTSGGGVTGDLHAAGAVVAVQGQRTCPFWRESCLLATYQLMLAAVAEGLAARTLMPASPNALAKVLRVPEEYTIFSVVLVARAGEAQADTRQLKPVGVISIKLPPPENPPV